MPRPDACPYRKLHPTVEMMETAHDRPGHERALSLNGTMVGRESEWSDYERFPVAALGLGTWAGSKILTSAPSVACTETISFPYPSEASR